MDTELLWRVEEFRRVVDSVFPVSEVIYDGGLPVFAVIPVPDAKERFLNLRAKVEPLGYLPLLRRRNGREVIALVPGPPRGQWRWSVNLLLFIATLATTFIAGYYMALGLAAEGYLSSAVGGGLAFSLSLMLILATHEMGHKVFSIVRGVDSSLPYFIPMIPPFGTMGAVIVTRTPAPNRDALMDVAAAGPLAGFLVSIPILIVGVARSFVISPDALQGGVNYPDPLIVKWLTQLILHPPEGSIVLGHPIWFAGWIGLLVTSLNLLPAGMLDGGHTVRALFGPRVHLVLSWIAVAATALLGYVLMAVVILLLLRRGHPGPLDDVSPVSPVRIAIGVALLAVFVLSAVPLRITPF